jgi:hypothetical protein
MEVTTIFSEKKITVKDGWTSILGCACEVDADKNAGIQMAAAMAHSFVEVVEFEFSEEITVRVSCRKSSASRW